MKARELAQLLELVVRKVVREELKPILSEVKRPQTPLIKEKKVSKSPEPFDPFDVSDILDASRTQSESPKVEYTKNLMLNEMLNDTRASGEWKSMDSTFGANQAQGFNKQSMASQLGYGEESMIPDTDVDGRPTNMEALQSSGVADALTKDYSGLMKAIAAKKGR